MLRRYLALFALCAAAAQADPAFWKFAPTPPMGWNSWDCFGTTLTEAEAKTQADAMAAQLKPFGWTYFTVDIQWYEGKSKGHEYHEGAALAMDEFGRLLPAVSKFPSAAAGAGFKPLADYIHSRGLKFGIHAMRGIPRQAVRQNTAILGTSLHAADIALTNSICPWNPDMFGVDLSRPGAQNYYDSVFAQYAAWGVDFVKVDDIARPYDEVQQAEIEAIRKAIDKTGRAIVLSLSPGDTPLARADHVRTHANMWRVSDDFWDRWPPLYGMLGRLDRWNRYRAPGAWPDGDMLPFGTIEFTRPTRFTKDEQFFCMSLWCIARSPLILGADMTKLDPFTLALLTNPEVLAVNQSSAGNRQLSRTNDLVVWAAEAPGSADRYVALLNAQDNEMPFDLSHPAFTSRVLRGEAGAEIADISVPITNAHQLVLLIGEGGGGLYRNHGAWIEPKLRGGGKDLKLTDLKWSFATAGWNEPQVNRTVENQPLTLNGKTVEGIGTHAVSVIAYDLPPGYDTFTARGALTTGSEGKGSIQFLVIVDPPVSLKPARSRVSVSLQDLGIAGAANVRDLWKRQDLGTFTNHFSSDIPLQGAGLFRITPVAR
ncbi:MAG: NPCBM/NEW2 domain-containing protein [Verrucomicrobiota bacterium]